MPRADNYYEQRLQQQETAQPKTAVQENVQQPKLDVNVGLEKAKQSAYNDYISKEANRSILSRMPYELANAVFDMPDQMTWDTMNAWEKYKHLWVEGGKTSWDMIKAMPANIVKAPLKISHGLLEGESRILEHYLGKNELSLPPSYNLPILGEIKGFGGSYDEGRAMGLSPFMSTVKATGEFAGDVAISASLVDTVNSIFRPRINTSLEAPATGKDFRPLQTEQVSQIGAKASEAKITGPEVLVTKQNPNISYFKLSKDAAGKYGGNSNNTFLKVSPIGNGQAEFSVVQVRKSFAEQAKDALYNKFGKSRVTEGELGPELKIESGIMKYQPEGYSKANTSISPISESKPGEIFNRLNETNKKLIEESQTRLAAKAEQESVLAGGGVLPAQAVSTSMSTPPVVTETPSIMKKPIKGFEETAVTEKQIGQVKYLADDMEINDLALRSISQAITGKQNLNDLTQNELYQVSETVRGFTKSDISKPEDFMPINRSFTHPARYWMEAAEREIGAPVYSQVYLPMEQSLRLAKVFNERWSDKSREIFGKYSSPKYVEERRALTDYIEGNKGAISNNESLSAETKADLIKIGDWLRSSYQEFFKNSGIKSDRFFETYSPRIRKQAGIKNLFKSQDLPPELKTFIEFEREGMMDPLEDDALALFDIYTRAFSRKQFVKNSFENAQRTIANSPDNIKKAASSYLQEKMGYQDALAETSQLISKKISKATNGLIPENIMEQIHDFAMTTSYAGALGLPRLMPILRNMVQPLLTTYPELGADFFADGVKRFMSEGGLKEIRDKGFLVNMKNPFGAELSEESGKGFVGRNVDRYKNINKAAMIPYASVDTMNRGVTYHGVKSRFENYWDKFKKGQISYDQFEEGIKMSGFNPTLQNVVRNKLMMNTEETLQEAIDMMTADILDRTQFPYRKGSQSRLHYGLGGKVGLQFAQWSWEYAFTLKSWLARGQYDNLLRWLGMGTAIKRSAEDIAGVDVSKWVLTGPFSGFPVGPIGKMTASLVSGVNAAFTGMTEDVNKNWKDIANSVKIYGGTLTGVGMQRVNKFLDSVKRYEAGVSVSTDPDQNKKFGVYSSTGKLLYWTDMSGLLKNLFGFDTVDKSEFEQRINTVEKENTEYNMKVNDAMNSLVDGNYEKFNKIVTDNNLMINDISTKLKSYNIPLDQRIFEKMPLNLKLKYFDAFYGNR